MKNGACLQVQSFQLLLVKVADTEVLGRRASAPQKWEFTNQAF